VNAGETEDLQRSLYGLEPVIVKYPGACVERSVERRWFVDRGDERECADRRERRAHRSRADDAWTV
jgi:hypothetical protein